MLYCLADFKKCQMYPDNLLYVRSYESNIFIQCSHCLAQNIPKLRDANIGGNTIMDKGGKVEKSEILGSIVHNCPNKQKNDMNIN